MPLVSVVMAVYNGEDYIAEAIDSMLAQTLADFELLIVDDGSQDNSAEIIRSCRKCDSRIRVFRHERNMGAADARNRALSAATGEYLTIMDCDDISMPSRLEKQVAFLQSNPHVDVVGVSGRAVSERLAPLFDLNMPQRHPLIVLDSFVGVGLIFSTIMSRRESLNAIGGYDDGRRAGEERYLTWRLLSQEKLTFANLPEQLLLYRRHKSSLSHNQDRQLQAERYDVLARMLSQLWDEAPPDTLERFLRLRLHQRLGWLDRRAARTDILRLIDSLISHKLIDAKDRPLLQAHMNRCLERSTPRRWQQFRHWWRLHIGHGSSPQAEAESAPSLGES